jgi:hypothetical protein
MAEHPGEFNFISRRNGPVFNLLENMVFPYHGNVQTVS